MSSSDSDSDLSDGHSSAEEHASHEGEAALPQPGKRKRKNRHKPMEMSSKRPVPAVRQAVEVPKRQVRDPRFESFSGNFNEDMFKKVYSFVDDYKLNEAQALRGALKKERNPRRKEAMQQEMQRLQQQIAESKRQAAVQEKLQAWKKEERTKVAQGKKPFFMKRSEVRKIELTEKYNELQKQGRLRKYMEKKRKRNAAKDHRHVPYRRGAEEDAAE